MTPAVWELVNLNQRSTELYSVSPIGWTVGSTSTGHSCGWWLDGAAVMQLTWCDGCWWSSCAGHDEWLGVAPC